MGIQDDLDLAFNGCNMAGNVYGLQGCATSILDELNDQNVELLEFVGYLNNIIWLHGFLLNTIGLSFMLVGSRFFKHISTTYGVLTYFVL